MLSHSAAHPRHADPLRDDGLRCTRYFVVAGRNDDEGERSDQRDFVRFTRTAEIDDKRHLSVGRDGFTLHAATRAGAMDERGRETLLKYVLRPPIAQERITRGPDGLVRIALKKPFSDGTFAVDLDPLSLLTRLCAAVPPPRFHTTRYAGVLASASKLLSRILPEPPLSEGQATPRPSARRSPSRDAVAVAIAHGPSS